MRVLGILILMLSPLCSEQWQIVGTRAMGMGGAYVAMAKGPIAQYWNPAGLAQASTQTFNGLEIPAGVGIEATGGILDNVSGVTDVSKQISEIQKSQTSGTIDANQMSAFVKTLGILGEMNKTKESGALVEANGGINLKVSKFAISVNNYTSVGLNPFIDVNNIKIDAPSAANLPTNSSSLTDSSYTDEKNNLANLITGIAGNSNLNSTNLDNLLCGTDGCLPSQIDTADKLATALVNQAISNGVSETDLQKFIDEASKYTSDAKEVIQNTGGSFDNNTSNLNIKAASFTEFSIGWAKYFEKLLPGLAIGGNLKLIRGDIAEKTFLFLNKDKTGDAFKDIFDNKKTSTKPSIDLGFLWDVNQKYPKLPFKPRVGLTIRNITGLKFDGPTSTYKLDPQARFGLAFSPFNWWHFALDIDLTKNSTPVDGYDSRQLAFGTEINILNKKSFNLPLRLGILKNLAENSSSTMYTAGIGLTFAYIHLDAAVGISSKKTEIDGDKYPEKGQAVVSLGILF